MQLPLAQWFKEDSEKRNFTVYGQWVGVLTSIICFATGISSVFYLSVLAWAIIAIISAVLINFLEVGWYKRCCPISERFFKFINMVQQPYPHAAVYIVLAVLQFLSTRWAVTSLVAAGVFLLITGIFWLLAGILGHPYEGSKLLGNRSFSEMIV